MPTAGARHSIAKASTVPLRGRSSLTAPARDDGHQNHLLDALPAADYARLKSQLEVIPTALGEVLYRIGSSVASRSWCQSTVHRCKLFDTHRGAHGTPAAVFPRARFWPRHRRSLCLDAQTALTASVQMSPIGDRWFSHPQRAPGNVKPKWRKQ